MNHKLTRSMTAAGAGLSLTLALTLGGTRAQMQPLGAQAALTTMGTAFTYQGRLTSVGAPVNGACDFQFALWDDASGGTQIGSTQTHTNVSVSAGYFTIASLDFGTGAFDGAARWLEIEVRCPAGSGSYAALSPRQALTATPYALYTANAPWGGVMGIPAGFADGIDNDTTYTAGAGISLSGTQFSIAATYQLPQSCSHNQVAKWNGSAWTCASDNDTTGFWSLSGNAGTTPGTHFVGTTDNISLVLRVNNVTAWRLSPSGANTPNVIGGNNLNNVTAGVTGATIGGGGFSPLPNRVTDDYGTVGGGANNRAGDNAGTTDSASYATVGGGFTNAASEYFATVGGGQANTASGDYATVSGGYQNTASGFAATVGGGAGNTAAGDYSFVAGWQAKNTNVAHDGVFLFADSTDAELTSTARNQFLVRAAGGITMYTNAGMTVGVRVNPGSGSWSSISDRALKENIAPVNARDILSRVAGLPIHTWNYKTQDAGIRHIGPMAQDFYAAFGVGEDDTHITTVDADGVALAAIQGLYQVVQDKDAQIAALQAQLAALEARLAALERK